MWNNTFKGYGDIIPKVEIKNPNPHKENPATPSQLYDAISTMHGYKKEYDLDYEFEFRNS